MLKGTHEAILKSEQAPALLAAAKKDGFKTMQETGRELIREGILSIEEYQANLNIEINWSNSPTKQKIGRIERSKVPLTHWVFLKGLGS